MWICHIYICTHINIDICLFIHFLCIYLCIGLLLDKYDHDFLRRQNVDCGLECGNSTIWRTSFSDWWIIAISRCLNHFLTLETETFHISHSQISLFLCGRFVLATLQFGFRSLKDPTFDWRSCIAAPEKYGFSLVNITRFGWFLGPALNRKRLCCQTAKAGL